MAGMLARVENGNQKSGPGFGASQSVAVNRGRPPVIMESRLARMQSAHGNQGMLRLVSGSVLQRKLTISQQGDVFEREADRVADAVMRMPVPAAAPQPIARTDLAAGVQRCSCDSSTSGSGQCEDCKTKAISLQRVSTGPSQGAMAPSIVHEVLRSPGQPLEAATRSFMEPRFGHDFSGTRVHADPAAAESARAVDALAYTVGHDVVLGHGQYAPQTTAGQRLLAHELTHVVQQTAGTKQGLTKGTSTCTGERHGVAPASFDGGSMDSLASAANSAHRASHRTAAGELLQRQGAGPAAHLQSPRFVPSAKLERCFEDSDRLRQGDPDSDAVTRIQQALIDVQKITGNTYDLGSTGPKGDGVDGVYGTKTAAAVRKFKTDEGLGSTKFGDVGPGVMHRLDQLFPPGPTPPAPTPPAPTPPAPGPTRVCGPDVSAETSRAWASARSVFGALPFAGKLDNCRMLVQPFIKGAGGLALNQDAFDTWGLFQGSIGWTRIPPWHGSCGTPGSAGNLHDNFDPLHEDISVCSNSVQIGSDCWLSGTPNYGLFGIAMRACSDFTGPLAGIPGISALHSLFSLPFTVALVGAYKLLKGDNIIGPEKWAIATYIGGPTATASGGNRATCSTTCAGPPPPSFLIVWEPNMPRTGMPAGAPYQN
jgi:peptidoglycan hydrolase-like protein with peptidoglycan-binding domain